MRPRGEVVARPAGVMGLEINTHDSPPSVVSPELEFQFLFGLWKSLATRDTPCVGAHSVIPRYRQQSQGPCIEDNCGPAPVLRASP